MEFFFWIFIILTVFIILVLYTIFLISLTSCFTAVRILNLYFLVDLAQIFGIVTIFEYCTKMDVNIIHRLGLRLRRALVPDLQRVDLEHAVNVPPRLDLPWRAMIDRMLPLAPQRGGKVWWGGGTAPARACR